MKNNKIVLEEVKVPDELLKERFMTNPMNEYLAILDKEDNCWYTLIDCAEVLRLVYRLDGQIKILRVKNQDLEEKIKELEEALELACKDCP